MALLEANLDPAGGPGTRLPGMQGDDEGRAAVGWDRARVLGLAPDDAARRAATTVPAAGWSESGTDGGVVWGRCRGSGRTPYDVVVDRNALAYGCSCPSRKLPCKHALALLLRWTDGQVPAAEPTPYVQRWLSGRGPAQQPRAARAPGELADPAAAAERAAARAQRVGAGLDELAIWIGDQLRTGLASLEHAGYAHLDAVAARMVDAQAPGVAGLLRAMPAELVQEGWPERVLERLAALHLLIQAHRRLAELPPDLAATVRSRIGYPTSRRDVLASPGVPDDWLPVGQVDTVEYRLETRRVWLWGATTRRWALWLTFAPAGQPPDSTFTLGQRFHGRLHFYPGSGQYRAVVGEPIPGADTGARSGVGSTAPLVESLAAARARFAALLAADPWAGRMPAWVEVVPVPPSADHGWRLRDADGSCRDVAGPEPWPLLAHARGRPVPVMVEWTPAGLRPLAVLDDGGRALRRAA